MYRFVSALLRPYGENQRFTPVDLTNIDLQEIFDTYRDGYIQLSNTALTQNVYVSLDTIRQSPNFVYRNVAFPTWLAAQGNTTIPGTTNPPTLTINQMTASDAIQADCKIHRFHPNDLAGVNSYATTDLTDVYLTKTLSDITPLQKSTLTTVGGLLHINVPLEKGLQIVDAGRTLDISGDNHIGVLSFEDIGTITQTVIQPTMIRNPTTLPKHQALYVNLGQSISDQSIYISLIGRLFALEEIGYRINGMGGIYLDFSKIDLPTLILESLGHIDLSRLGLDETLYQSTGVSRTDLSSDAVILAILALPQTFVIQIDAVNVSHETQLLGQTGMNGIYELTTNTNLPYRSERRFMYPYWKVMYSGQYNNVYRFYLRDTTYRYTMASTAGYEPPTNHLSLQRQPQTPVEFDSGHLLNIFVETLTMK